LVLNSGEKRILKEEQAMIALAAVILVLTLLLLTDQEKEQRRKIKALRIKQAIESSKSSKYSKSSKPLWVRTIQDRVERRRQEILKGRLGC
jgi:Flp pilus assembly protein TadB